MSEENIISDEELVKRKLEHLILCSTDKVAFKQKTTGFELFDFVHCAVPPIDIDEINLNADFFGFNSNYPFFISCMTGGTNDLTNINLQLAEAASELNIPLGLGSQRYALGSEEFYSHFEKIKETACDVPIIGNIGAAQIAEGKYLTQILKLIEYSGVNAFAIHLNPAQELFQVKGDTNFENFYKNLEDLIEKANVPFIAKEVGSGISAPVIKNLLDCGVEGIDVAGAGGTSWTAVEILRNGEPEDQEFWDWGLPTVYCINQAIKIKAQRDFMLTGSGGINTAFDIAKALALGCDFTASARIILRALNESGTQGVINFVNRLFKDVKRIMYLTGASSLTDFNTSKLIKKEEFYK